MQKAVTVIGAAAVVVAFGFVPISVHIAGGAGWPFHDVLHPILGLFLGPVYGPVSAVLGAAMSEVLSPYTALNGWSPLMAGVSSFVSAVLVRRRRREGLIWGIFFGVGCVGLAVSVSLNGLDGIWTSSPFLLLSLTGVGLAALTPVRSWCRRYLQLNEQSWRSPVALYGACFLASSVGVLPLWGVSVTNGMGLSTAGTPTGFYVLIRVFLPLVGMLLGMMLWPVVARKLFSVANQLRYGLPLFILATFLFAGRLFIDQAHQASQAETMERLHEQSRAAARTIDVKLQQAQDVLRVAAQRPPSAHASPLFRWQEDVSIDAAVSSMRSADVRALVRRTRRTAQVQRVFLMRPDTAAVEIGVAVPLSADGAVARTRDKVAQVVVGGLETEVVRDALDIWGPVQGELYLVDREHRAMMERREAPPTAANPAPLVERLLTSADSTANAPAGRYGDSVIGAAASLAQLPGYVVIEQGQQEAYRHLFDILLTIVSITLLACFGALAVGFYVSERMVTPLNRIIEAARRVGDDDLSVQVTVDQDNELGELADAFNTMTSDLAESIRHLRDNEERLRIALDAAKMGTWNWTAESETVRWSAQNVQWSPQTYVLLEVDPARTERLYEAFLTRVHPEDRARVVDRIQSVLQHQSSFSIEHRVQLEDGEVRWMRLQGRVYREETRPQRMSGILMDITSQKEAKQELMAAKEEAEEMSRLKSAFLANVSHEIRTPLTSIIGFAEVLAEEVTSDHQERVEKILRSGRRLKRTLNSVLDLSMIEAGEFTLDCRPFNIVDEVHQQVNLIRPRAERKGLDLRVDVPDERVAVELDPNCLDRILTNLLTNAIKFTETGHVAVRVRATEHGNRLEVADTGIGISEEFRAKLFEPFRQESRGLQREHDGTGLGLSITKKLVDLMEGDIELESKKGEGTTVTVWLPYCVAEKTKSAFRMCQENDMQSEEGDALTLPMSDSG